MRLCIKTRYFSDKMFSLETNTSKNWVFVNWATSLTNGRVLSQLRVNLQQKTITYLFILKTIINLKQNAVQQQSFKLLRKWKIVRKVADAVTCLIFTFSTVYVLHKHCCFYKKFSCLILCLFCLFCFFPLFAYSFMYIYNG